jgi:Putative beta-barrel porin-2, OmpL-like. bbp2
MHAIFRFAPRLRLLLIPFLLHPPSARAQAVQSAGSEEVEQLKATVRALADRVEVLEEQLGKAHPVSGSSGPDAAAALSTAARELNPPAASTANSAAPIIVSDSTRSSSANPASILPTLLPGGATLNYLFDGYYEYNLNAPIGRVNYLRVFDVLSNSFSLNQADIVFALDPDVEHGRRYGMRVDLQFGQATETLQGNPANERRPEIYQNIFQAYGTYVFPIGKGLEFDFGKWSSSLGIEGNYAKDQMNYTRSLYFNFLPFYHNGVRATYHITDKISANYWIVNGTEQSEATNSFKDELFGFTVQPAKSVTWNVNYYLGQEHFDNAPSTTCGPAPVQPGLCVTAISPAPDGKLNIFDSYATWNATPKLTLALEGDYVIEREWANAAPGQSSAPSHVDGGAAYVQYQLNPKMSFAGRGEYLADPQGLFSNVSQALKEGTATFKYQVVDGLDAFVEYRRDWSNQNYFLTDKTGALINSQPTLAVGMVWWYGGKQGPW